jgi:hypothetical protein
LAGVTNRRVKVAPWHLTPTDPPWTLTESSTAVGCAGAGVGCVVELGVGATGLVVDGADGLAVRLGGVDTGTEAARE